jgi:replication-associated recombination protein RarA
MPQEQRPDESFELKYRPLKFRELIGQDEIVESVRNLLDNGRKRCFFFSGPPGVGKTTTARLIVGHLGNGDPRNVDFVDRDGAVYSGADRARELVDGMRY